MFNYIPKFGKRDFTLDAWKMQTMLNNSGIKHPQANTPKPSRRRGGGTLISSVPAQAARVGFTNLTFDSGFGSIDLADTQQSGFSWYIGNWFGAPSSNPSNFLFKDGALTVGGTTV